MVYICRLTLLAVIVSLVQLDVYFACGRGANCCNQRLCVCMHVSPLASPKLLVQTSRNKLTVVARPVSDDNAAC